MTDKKRKAPAPTGVGQQTNVRLQSEEIVAIDAWRREQPDLPTRPEAIRRLVRMALKI